MKHINLVFTSLLTLLVLFACGPKKDTITRRNYQTLVTKYNVIFNGKVAFNEGIEEINNNYNETSNYEKFNRRK